MELTPYKNIAAYKFVHLDESFIDSRRPILKRICKSSGVRGTIILAPEGINLFLCGLDAGIDNVWNALIEQPAFADLIYKESRSEGQVFNRMLVKKKREIIPFGIPEANPLVTQAPRITPAELYQWYQEGKDFVILDTRNDYEVDLGTFRNAMHLNLESFRDFPKALETLSPDLKDKPIVTFCTGGIRCEKAAPLMQNLGYREVVQLDGGILKYFEECGPDYYDGECFVFDHRVAVDGNLQETATAQCFRCQQPVTVEDQKSPQYVIGVSCPHCHDQRDVTIQLSSAQS